MKKFKIITLGCKVNQAESAAIAGRLAGPDWQPADSAEEADLCLINTCTVTRKAALQSRQAVRQAIRANPQACIAVTGCYAETDPQALMDIKGLDCIVGQAGKSSLPGIIHACGIVKRDRPTILDSPGDASGFDAAIASVIPAARTRPFLKIQDGCDAFCTYCIVPYARGRSRSTALHSVLAGIEHLAAQGFHEVVLTGIHIGFYGRDLEPASSLQELLQHIAALKAPPRVRLSSIEPLELTDEILDLVAGSDRFCRHFHIPLQSGDADILKRMGRPYSPDVFGELVRKIHRQMPDAAIGVDVLAGFPGETEAAFENTFQLLQGLPVSYLHVFPFSARPGTAAYAFPGHVPAQEIQQRCTRLRHLGSRKRRAFHRRFIGRLVKVLVEGRRDPQTGLLKGVSSNYLPVLFEGGDELMNRLVPVRMTDADARRLRGVLADSLLSQDPGGAVHLL